jgi:hypothetical protein
VFAAPPRSVVIETRTDVNYDSAASSVLEAVRFLLLLFLFSVFHSILFLFSFSNRMLFQGNANSMIWLIILIYVLDFPAPLERIVPMTKSHYIRL